MSGYKTIERVLPWTDRTEWRWPAGDEKLVGVFHQCADIEVIMRHVDKRGVCVQAGGACGVWPLRFSQLFERVITFEPLRENYHCLKKNTSEASNIDAINAPLGNDSGRYSIHNDIHELKNFGAGYIVPDPKGTQAQLIDNLQLEACDLIQLDIEGGELDALKGASLTISEFRPVIVLEEKRLNHVRRPKEEARLWLQDTFGYRLVESINRDVILKC